MSSHRAEKCGASRRRRTDVDPTSNASTTGPTGARSTGRGGAHALPRRSGGGRSSSVLTLPTVIGATALTLASVGALTVGTSQAGTAAVAAPVVYRASLGSAALGAEARLSVLSGRERAVSRDSRRKAVAEATDRDLQAAAERRAKQRDAALDRIAADAEKQAGLIAKDAWQLPVAAGVYHLTSRFGECSGLWSHCHTGLDFASPSGTPIHAVVNGTVTEAGFAGAYGNQTIVTLEDGTEMWYCHQTTIDVSVGQAVRAGEVIGTVGSTGNTTGPHLHLEVRPSADHPVDPFAALASHGVTP